MLYQDRIYGEVKIEEPVILELIKSKPIQRLKGIAQHGIPQEFYSWPGFSRFEHSLGVTILLKRLDADLEEQIAGLLHDVSQTAFSHVFDWILGEREKENSHDKVHQRFILNCLEIVKILMKFHFIPLEISKIDSFTLLEQEIPHLCADRSDYALREFYLWANPKIVKVCLDTLINYDGQIVFNNSETAKFFAETYLKCQTEHWGGYEAVEKYYLFSKVFKEALDKNILSLEDFYQDDNFIIRKIQESEDDNLINILEKLKNKRLDKLDHGDKQIFKKKFRYVDPKILENGRIFTLSSISSAFKNFLENQRLINLKGIEI